MQATGRYTKRALKCEDDGTPVGQPHKMYLDCQCGEHLSVPNPFTGEYVPCPCGMVYDSSGWVVNTEVHP